jgi:hypothetical protein
MFGNTVFTAILVRFVILSTSASTTNMTVAYSACGLSEWQHDHAGGRSGSEEPFVLCRVYRMGRGVYHDGTRKKAPPVLEKKGST